MKKILIKQTSKSGVLAKIEGVYGQLRNNVFVAFTQEELNKKTAYKDSYGWEEYSSIEEYSAERANFKLKREIIRKENEVKMTEYRNSQKNKLQQLIKKGSIPSTIENIKLIATVLSEQNWGSWELPKMTIGYSANQYDCDGKIAVTIILDKPIEFKDYFENKMKESKFSFGTPRGHLEKYYKL